MPMPDLISDDLRQLHADRRARELVQPVVELGAIKAKREFASRDAPKEHGPWEDYQAAGQAEHGPWKDFQESGPGGNPPAEKPLPNPSNSSLVATHAIGMPQDDQDQANPTTQVAASFAKKVKEYAAYLPYLGLSATAGLVKPFLAPFEGTRFDSNKMLADAIAYWKGQTGDSAAAVRDVGLFPYKEGAGIFETEDPNTPTQGLKIPGLNAVVRPYSLPVKELAGQTAHGMGFMAGPVRAGDHASALAIDAILPEATPAVLKALGRGITTGSLLGEGKPDLTAENALTFALFDVLGHSLGASSEAARDATEKITSSDRWGRMSTRERSQVIQGIEDKAGARQGPEAFDKIIYGVMKEVFPNYAPPSRRKYPSPVQRPRVEPKPRPIAASSAGEAPPPEPQVGWYVCSGSYTGHIDRIAYDGSIISGDHRIPAGLARNFAVSQKPFRR